MKITELFNIMEAYKLIPYQYNKDETGEFILEDGINFANSEGENIIEALFTDDSEVCELSHKFYKDGTREYLELTKDIDKYVHNYLKLVTKDLDYMSDNLTKFAKCLKDISKNLQVLNNHGLFVEVEENYVNIKGRNTVYSIYAKYDNITQEFRWCSNESLVEPDRILESIIDIAKEKDLVPFWYLYDPSYTANSVVAISSAIHFLKAVEEDKDVNQGVEYGEIVCNYFELNDIPPSRQDLIDKIKSRSYTQEELGKYGYFKKDIYGCPIEVESIQE